MTGKYLIRYIVLSIVVTVFIAKADLFPAREGNWWLFSYTKTRSNIGASQFDSGTVLWRIIKIEPGNASYWIKIQQQRDQIRYKTMATTYPPSGVDSLFDPPHSMLDTLTLAGEYNKNGLTFINDSCVSLLSQAGCASGQCTLSSVSIVYQGKTIIGNIVDPVPCREPNPSKRSCAAPRKFTQADGIGPVAFESSQSPCIMDANYNEKWALSRHYASNRWIAPNTIFVGSSITLALSTFEYTCAPDSFVKSISDAQNGITMVYRPVYNPAADCMPIYGYTTRITYQYTPTVAGKFPVFVESQPACAPLCKMASMIECIDTLVVLGAADVKGRAIPFAKNDGEIVRMKNGAIELYNAYNYNGSLARLLDGSGRLLGRANISQGRAIFNVKILSAGKVVFVAIGKNIAWRCLIR